jgi:CRP-like cAMP-binding protein
MEQKSRYLLGNGELDRVIKLLNPTVKDFKRGEVILRENKSEHRLLFLLGGTAYLVVENEFNGKQILGYYLKGQVLLHDMLVQPHNGQCYITAKQPCTVAFVQLSAFEKYRQKTKDREFDYLPTFVFRSALVLSQQRCHVLQQKTIRSKFLTYLHCEAERQSSFTIRLPIPYSDLADYLSVDRSSLMKEVGRLCTDGIIEKKARQITLLAATLYT